MISLSSPTVLATCPACDRQMETNAADARTGIVCPHCATGFIPEKVDVPVPLPQPQPRIDYETRRLEKIRLRAENLSLLGSFSLVAAGIAFFFAVAQAVDYKSSTSMDRAGFTFSSLSYTCAFLSLAFALHLLANIVHIRVNLEKK